MTSQPRFASIALLASSLAVLNFSPAHAGTLRDFNLIAFGDVTGASEVEGRSAVFGNISGNTKNFVVDEQGLSGPVSTSGLNVEDGLIVGNQILGDVNVNNGANVRIAGNNSGSIINNNGGGTTTFNDPGVPALLSEVTANVNQAASYFASLAANSTINLSDLNNAVFNATPVDGLAVFDTTAALFNRNGTFDLAGDLGADLYLIRVAGDPVNVSAGLNPTSNEFAQDAFQALIVFYFEDAQSLAFPSGLGGAIFAPQANLTVTNPVEGTIVVNNVVLNSEIHLPTFTPDTNQIPEPRTMVLCVGAAGVLLGARMKRFAIQ